LARDIVAELGWTQPWFVVSALARENTLAVCRQVQRFFEATQQADTNRVDMLPGDVRARGDDAPA
jgi:GTP-binding protein